MQEIEELIKINNELSELVEEQIEFLSMLIVQHGDWLGTGLVVQIEEQIKKLKYKE